MRQESLFPLATLLVALCHAGDFAKTIFSEKPGIVHSHRKPKECSHFFELAWPEKRSGD